MQNATIVSGVHRRFLSILVAAIGLLASTTGNVQAGTIVFWLESDTLFPMLEWTEPPQGWVDFEDVRLSEVWAPSVAAPAPLDDERLSSTQQYDLFCEILAATDDTSPQELLSQETHHSVIPEKAGTHDTSPKEATESVTMDFESETASAPVWLALRDAVASLGHSETAQSVARQVTDTTRRSHRAVIDSVSHGWESASHAVRRATSAMIDSTAQAAAHADSADVSDESWARLIGDENEDLVTGLDEARDDDSEDRAVSVRNSVVRPVLTGTATLLDSLSSLLSDLSLQLSNAAATPATATAAQSVPHRS